MQTSSELITLSKLVDDLKDEDIVIPLLQRNYKWGIYGHDKSEATAEKLLADIQNAKAAGKNEYTIGMVTLYVNNGEIQVIDGQQRMVTLSLLAKALGKYSEFPRLKFQRDTDDKEREKFLQNHENDEVSQNDKISSSVDVRHMEAAFKMFHDKLDELQCSSSMYLNNLCKFKL